MQQTANYQLNQWDGEDRIMRVDFNSDNAKIDAALQQNAAALSQATADLQSALETERQARASGDTAASQATASAKQELLNAITAEQSARSSGDTAIRGEFAAADAAIRQEFAAADAAVSTACPIVKLQSVVTSQPATQVDLDMRDPSYRNMSFLILIPHAISSTKYIYLRVNGLTGIYNINKSSTSYLTLFPPCNTSTKKWTYSFCRVELYAELIACTTQTTGYDGADSTYSSVSGAVQPISANADTLQTFNFLAYDGATINAGSRFTLYGVKL